MKLVVNFYLKNIMNDTNYFLPNFAIVAACFNVPTVACFSHFDTSGLYTATELQLIKSPFSFRASFAPHHNHISLFKVAAHAKARGSGNGGAICHLKILK